MLKFSSLSLYTSNYCDLACKYCFLPKERKDSSIKILAEILDTFFKKYAKSPVSIHIFGTEPLLRWDLLQFVFLHSDMWAKHLGWPLRKGITTNGVTLTRQRAKWLTEHNINCLCSIDGMKEQHDKWRVFPSGKGSYSIVAKNFKFWLKLNPTAEAAMVVTPDSIPNLRKNIECLLKLGFKVVMLNKSLYPGPEYTWKDLQLLKEKLTGDIVELIEDNITNQTYPWIGFLTNNLVKRYQKKYHKNITTNCGAGKGSIAAGINGKFFYCHQAIHYQEFQIGDAWKGIDEEKVLQWRRRRHFQCLSCPVLECSPCDIRNFEKFGDIHFNCPSSCGYNYILWEATKIVEERLKKDGCYDKWIQNVIRR